MAFGLNHLLTDATAFAEVGRLWALHTADVSCGRQQTYRAKVANMIDAETRKGISTPSPVAMKLEDPNWTVSQTEHSQLCLAPVSISISFFENTKYKHLSSVNGGSELTKWYHRSFSPEILIALKQGASGSDSSKWISTMNSVTGMFWSRLYSIHQKIQDGHSTPLCIFPVNMRPRLDPPVGSDFIGNRVDLVLTTSMLKELEYDALGLQVAAYFARSAILELMASDGHRTFLRCKQFAQIRCRCLKSTIWAS